MTWRDQEIQNFCLSAQLLLHHDRPEQRPDHCRRDLDASVHVHLHITQDQDFQMPQRLTLTHVWPSENRGLRPVRIFSARCLSELSLLTFRTGRCRTTCQYRNYCAGDPPTLYLDRVRQSCRGDLLPPPTRLRLTPGLEQEP